MLKVVLWDTRRGQKRIAGRVETRRGSSQRCSEGKFVRAANRRVTQPYTLDFALLAAILKQLGNRVVYSADRIPRADVFLFIPGVDTLECERRAMSQIARKQPTAKVFVLGPVASAAPELFNDVNAVVLKGEPEQLKYQWPRVLRSCDEIVDMECVTDLDDLPIPDWSCFKWKDFRFKNEFSRFPSASVLHGRRAIWEEDDYYRFQPEVLERRRSPGSVLQEIQYCQKRYGFESFKLIDPQIGADREDTFRLAERLASNKKQVQFSMDGNLEFLDREMLLALKDAGLYTLNLQCGFSNNRGTERLDGQVEALNSICRELGIRTVGQVSIGYPGDTRESVLETLDKAIQVNPTLMLFNIVSPFHGSPFYELLANGPVDLESGVYEPDAACSRQNLSLAQVQQLREMCYRKFYLRKGYLKENARLASPAFNRLLPFRRAA